MNGPFRQALNKVRTKKRTGLLEVYSGIGKVHMYWGQKN